MVNDPDPPLKGWSRLRDLVQSVYRPQRPFLGAEIGVSQGWTSEHLLHEFPSLCLWMIDFWDSSPIESEYAKSGDSMAKLTGIEQAAKMKRATDRTEFASERRRIIKADSVEAAKGVPDGWLDWCFVDGDHTLDGVRRDLTAWAPKVRTGGLLIGHDFLHPRDKRGLWGVERAWREFCSAKTPELFGNEKATMCWCEVGMVE